MTIAYIHLRSTVVQVLKSLHYDNVRLLDSDK